jgi:hypothetical protein
MTDSEKIILKTSIAKMEKYLADRDNPELSRFDQTQAKQNLIVELTKLKSLLK